jgi:diadenosine tetraphosphate (Ap4A) HIT family hydrolase
LPRILRAVLAATNTKTFNVLQNNGADAHQAVLHVHFTSSRSTTTAAGPASMDSARASFQGSAPELAASIVSRL